MGGKKGIRPVKNEWWGAGVVTCLQRDADLHMAQLIPLHRYETHTHTHTTVLLLFWNMSGTTRVSRYQKGKTRKVKTNLDL